MKSRKSRLLAAASSSETLQLPKQNATKTCASIGLAILPAVAAFGFGVFTTHSSKAVAQETAVPVCVATQEKGGPGDGRPFVIAVSPDKVGTYLDRGFKAVGCGSLKLKDQGQRSQMCDFATSGNKVVEIGLWRRFGVTPSELCRDIKGVARQ